MVTKDLSTLGNTSNYTDRFVNKSQISMSKTEIKEYCNELIKTAAPNIGEFERMKYDMKILNKQIFDLKTEVIFYIK